MTEAEWLGMQVPWGMIAHLRTDRRYSRTKAGRRKLRLFGCAACWRAYAAYPHDPGCRRRIENAEAVADGRAAPDRRSWRAVIHPWPTDDDAPGHLAMATRFVQLSDVRAASGRAAVQAAWAAAERIEGRHAPKITAEYRSLAAVLRDIAGNPFRPVPIDPRWLTSTVVAIAEGVYHDRAFDRLPILADALEDAGCDSAGLLAHCRGPGPHARGCWAVDLVLGKG